MSKKLKLPSLLQQQYQFGHGFSHNGKCVLASYVASYYPRHYLAMIFLMENDSTQQKLTYKHLVGHGCSTCLIYYT